MVEALIFLGILGVGIGLIYIAKQRKKIELLKHIINTITGIDNE